MPNLTKTSSGQVACRTQFWTFFQEIIMGTKFVNFFYNFQKYENFGGVKKIVGRINPFKFKPQFFLVKFSGYLTYQTRTFHIS